MIMLQKKLNLPKYMDFFEIKGGKKFEGEIELGYTDPATSLTYTIYGRIETTIE